MKSIIARNVSCTEFVQCLSLEKRRERFYTCCVFQSTIMLNLQRVRKIILNNNNNNHEKASCWEIIMITILTDSSTNSRFFISSDVSVFVLQPSSASENIWLLTAVVIYVAGVKISTKNKLGFLITLARKP